MRLPRWKPLTVHHLLAMFDAHRSSASGNITYLICHMTSQDHVIERSCEVTDGSTPLYVTVQPSLMAIGIVVVEICFSFFKLSQKTMWLYEPNSLKVSHQPSMLGGYRYYGSVYIMLFSLSNDLTRSHNQMAINL